MRKKYKFCEECDNFRDVICYDNTKDFKTEKIQEILKSPISKIEKSLKVTESYRELDKERINNDSYK